jgi:hypothetical protein
MNIKFIICLSALLAVAATTNVTVGKFELPAAKVTIKVLDENQQPLADANVWLTFKDRGTFEDLNVRGLTGANGLFTGEGGCDASGVGCGITKDGYYMGWAPIPKFYGADADNRRQPWNETYTAILRPICKPVALYAKKVQANVPVLGQPCGYDLEAGDWVAPYGKGMKKDLVFTIRTKEVKDAGNFDAQGELTFANPMDGLQGTLIPDIGKNSMFKWERQAPENGYQPKFQLQNTWWESLHQKPVRSFKFGGKEWEGSFFRVRTVEQDGKIVSAHYGKIRGGIEIEPRETPTCTIIFTYYFNPTPNDRNLEWDTKKNLFGGLKGMESPREP